jgi:eukaryotic-like serine/threonine-protein kinase
MLPEPGELFARRYRIVRELGRGAMGVVFEARHETLGRVVALKVLRPTDADDERAVRRFEREARIAAKLESPHVVKVLDVDRTDENIPYLVMERLHGRDLARVVEGEPELSTREIVRWMLAVCDAMTTAHAAGVVHRDLKLSNVFLCDDGTVKVLDFGVAAFRGGDADRSTTASVAGTPRYMAPEQLLGEAPHAASDVWAVGVMLYRLLSRRFPYDTPTMAAQMLAIMDGCPPLLDVAPGIDPGLSRVVHRALGRTLEERYASIDDLAADLRPFAEASELASPREPASLPPTRGRRRHVLALLGGGALLALAAVHFTRAPAPPSSAREPAGSASPPAPSPAPPAPPPAPPLAPPPTVSAVEKPQRASPPTALPPASASSAGDRAPARRRPSVPAPSTAPPAAASSPRSDDGFPTHL